MKIKRIISGILSFCVAAAMVSAPMPMIAVPTLTVSAYEDGALQKDGIFTYCIEDGKVTIIKCDADATEAVIPDTIEGLSVINVAPHAFQDCSELTSVTLPDTLENLGERAFWNCSKLAEIHIPPTLTVLSRNMFEGCLWWEEQLKAGEYVIVNSVLLAPSKVSKGTRSIPEGVTKIGEYAFSNDTGLTSLQLPEGLTDIGSNAFMFCSNLNEISFPSSLTTIGQHAFLGTPWLSAQQQKNPLVQVNGILIDGTKVSGDVTLPDTVTSIAGHAFESSSLTSITIPDTVRYIGSYAFCGCKNLQTVKLPDNLTALSEYCFYVCTSLTSVDLPDGLTNIPADCFGQCNSLTSVSLPEGITAIHDGAFMYCENLTEIKLPTTLKTIGLDAFNSCRGLKAVVLPDSLEIIKPRAFRECTALTEITIPGKVREMIYAFPLCTSLRSVHISASVPDLEQAFAGCPAIESLTVDPDNQAYKAVDNVLFSKDGSRLILYPQKKPDTAYTVPDTVTVIESYAFQNAADLTSITLPEHMDEIGGGAFMGCTALKKITVPEGIKTLEWTFKGCHSLESITLPKSLSQIGDTTFYCEKLKEIRFNGSVQDWSRITVGDANQSLYQAVLLFADEDSAAHEKFTLYTAEPSSIIPAENVAYQIQTASDNAAFAVIAGNAAEVSETGLVTPTKNYGETIIQITDGDTVSFLHVTTEDYAPIYADNIIKEFLNDNITDDMTDLEKLEVIGKLPASMDYNADHWDYIEMLAYNSGNCAGSATMLAEMCRRLGIKAWVRNAKRDPGAGSAHVNALAEVDGAYYELEAGFEGKAPRSYTITKRTSLYKYQEAADGIDICQYDGINDAKTSLEIPDRIDGKTVTRIGDGFLTENPWVKTVTIPDTVTEISESAFPDYKGILFGGKGSAAEKFAEEHDIAFRVTGSLAKGDVNADLDVDILDVIALNKHILGVGTLDKTGLQNADMDGNGIVDSADPLALLKTVLGIVC